MQKVVLYTWVAVGMVFLYLSWVFAMRFGANRTMDPAAHSTTRSYRNYPGTSGTGVMILQFYANTGDMTEGEHAVLCYGVERARAVRLEPEVETLRPSLNRCIAVEPAATTTYTLIAEGFDGRKVSESVTVNVHPAPPEIVFFATSEKQIRRGEPFTLCYGMKHAAAARLEPVGMRLSPGPKVCVRMFPAQTTSFSLVAADDSGRTDRAKFTVQVR